MTLVMNQMLGSKLIEADDEEGKDNNKSIEKQEDDAMVLWDCVSLFDTEEEKGNKSIENQEEDALVLWDCVSMFDTEKEGYLK